MARLVRFDHADGRIFWQNRRTMRAIFLTILVSSVFAVPAFSQDLPDGPGKDLVMKVCTSCHGAENFTTKRNSKEEWRDVVKTMIEFGAEAKDEEVDIIVNYLTKNWGKSAIHAAGATPLRRR